MRIRFVSSVLVIGVLSFGALMGQTSDLRQPTRKDVERQIVQLVFEYWTPKLNDYRRFIDRSLSAPDLTQLNTLRLRFAFLMEEERQREAARRAELAEWRAKELATEGAYEQPENQVVEEVRVQSEGEPADATAADGSTTTSAPITITNETMSPAPVPSNVDVDEQAYGDVDDGDDMDTDGYGEVGDGVDAEALPHDESGESPPIGAHAEAPTDLDDVPPHVADMDEGDRLRMETFSLTARYGTMSDLLRRRVMEDFSGFVLVLADLVEGIMKAHPEMTDGPDVEELARMHDNGSRREMAEELVGHEWSELRVFVMLYNGQGLAPILAGMGVRDLEGIDMRTASSTDLSEGTGQSGLLQNSPNPASASTVIAFRLAEPSPRTHLAIFSAHGQEMHTIDLGVLAAGEHETTVDVSSYPAGTFVYHLSAQSSMGEEVFSKMMQVVR